MAFRHKNPKTEIRKIYYNRKTIRLQNYDYSQNGMYFITICTKNRECILSTIQNSSVGACIARPQKEEKSMVGACITRPIRFSCCLMPIGEKLFKKEAWQRKPCQKNLKNLDKCNNKEYNNINLSIKLKGKCNRTC